MIQIFVLYLLREDLAKVFDDLLVLGDEDDGPLRQRNGGEDLHRE